MLLRVLLPFTAAFFLQELHRTVSAVVAAPAMAELGLTAAEMGRAARASVADRGWGRIVQRVVALAGHRAIGEPA